MKKKYRPISKFQIARWVAWVKMCRPTIVTFSGMNYCCTSFATSSSSSTSIYFLLDEWGPRRRGPAGQLIMHQDDRPELRPRSRVKVRHNTTIIMDASSWHSRRETTTATYSAIYFILGSQPFFFCTNPPLFYIIPAISSSSVLLDQDHLQQHIWNILYYTMC